MLNYLIGSIKEVFKNYIIIEVKGFGFKIYVTNPLFYKINEEYKILVYLYKREDIIELYGFINQKQKDIFLYLLDVNGVGPKTAFSIISQATNDDIINSINNEDFKFFKRISGVGSKVGMQIIFSLKDKMCSDGNGPTSKYYLIKSALINFGYKSEEIDKTLKNHLFKEEDLDIKYDKE